MSRISLVCKAFALTSAVAFPTVSNMSAQPVESTNSDSEAVNRKKLSLLTSPGIFGSFSTYKIKPEYNNLSGIDKKVVINEILSLVKKHNDNVIVDAYLTGGLSSKTDILLRVHSENLSSIQNFLLDINRTKFGNFTQVTDRFIGVTKSLSYISKDKSPTLNNSLFSAAYSGNSPRYVIVIPIKKSATWWNIPEPQRLEAIMEHTVKTLPYLVNTRRKLYHSTGIDDCDFITYFETDDLISFHNLLLQLAQIPENTFHTRYGDPTIVGTIHSIESVLQILSGLEQDK